MTQIEFENQMRDLRTQKGAELNAIAKMQGEVKEEIAAIDRQVKELRAKREKLNQQRIMFANRRFDLEREWGGKFDLSTRLATCVPPRSLRATMPLVRPTSPRSPIIQ